MKAWKKEVLKRFPELKSKYEADFKWDETPDEIWVDVLLDEFKRAHEEPMNRDLIRRVYEYAMWSISSRDDDIVSAAIVAFYEDIPGWPSVRKELPNYMSIDEFDGIQNLFKYGRTDAEFEEFVREFHEAKGRIES